MEKRTQKIPYNITYIYSSKIMLIEGEYVTDSEIPPSDHELKKTIYTNVTRHFNIKNDVPCLLAFTVTSFKVSELKPGVYISKIHTYIGAGGRFQGEDVGEWEKIS